MYRIKIEKKCKENNLTFIGYCNKENVYINNKTKLHLKCNICGYEWDTTSYDKFISRLSKCAKCNNKVHMSEEEILKKIHKRCKELNFTFIDFKNEYINPLKTKLILKCNECNKEWDTTTINNFLRKDRKSHKCGHKNPCFLQTSIKDIDKVINDICNIIKNSSMEYVGFKGEYKGVKNCIVLLKCKKCNEIIEYTYHTLKYSKNAIKCKECEFNGKLNHDVALNKINEKCKILDYTFMGFDTFNGLYDGKRTKLILKCNKCGFIWKTSTYISFVNKVLKCKNCLNSWQLEKEVESILKKHNINYEKQKKFEWLRYKLPLSLDFYLPEYNIFIECQGRQHFVPVESFGAENGFIETTKRDAEKYYKCKEHGIKPLYYGNKNKWRIFFDEEIITNEIELIKRINKNG